MASVSGDSSRITKMLKETVVLLCENSLSFTTELHVQALLAISVDRSTIFAVQIDEKLAKNGETVAGVSSGTSHMQGQVLSEQRPPAARRLALPAPPVSSHTAQRSSDDGNGLAWPLQSPQTARAVRTRGPRFPVGRGRGVPRGGRGRGSTTIRGGAPMVRMIRTAVSSVKFPMSRARMQAPHRAVRPVRLRSPFQRLALPPAPGGSAGNSPRQLPTAVVRQRTPAPVRQALSYATVQRPVSQPAMRKPSPRLAIMPPTQSSPSGAGPGLRQHSSTVFPRQAGLVQRAASPRGVGKPTLSSSQQSSLAGSQSGVRQQSPLMLPRQAGAVRAVTSPRGVGRPRLAIMPSQAHSSLANSQSTPAVRQQSPSTMPGQAGTVRAAASPQGMGRPRLGIVSSSPRTSVANMQSLALQSPTQPRAVPPQSSPRLAVMPPVQSSNKSPSGITQQTPATAPAKYQLQFVGRQQSPAVVKPEISPGLNQNLVRLASQLSSSSVGTQLRAVVEQLSKQQRQPSPSKQSTQVNPPAAVTAQASIWSAHSTPVNLTDAALPQPVVAVNLSQTGNEQVSSSTVASTQSPSISSRPRYNAAELSNLLLSSILSPSRSTVMPTPIAVPQQRVAQTSTASITSAAVSYQPVGHPTSVSQTSRPQGYIMMQSGIPNTFSNLVAQIGSTTVPQRLGMQSDGVTTPMASRPSEMMGTFLPAPLAQFSPARIQPVPFSQLTAVPLYNTPAQAAAAVPPSPAHRTEAFPRGILPRDVLVPRSPFGVDRAAGDTRSVTGVQGHMVKQPEGATARQLVLSPQPVPQAAVAQLQQRVMSQFSPQRQACSSAPQAFLMSSVFTDNMTCSPQQQSSPLASHTPAVVLQQQRSHNSAQVSSLAQSQISAAYVHRMNQNPQQIPSLVSDASAQQRSLNSEQVTSLQSQTPAAARQQEVLAPLQGQVFPGYMPKLTQSSQQVSAQMSAVSVPQSRQQEGPMPSKMASVQQRMQCQPQVTAATANQMSPVSVHHSRILPAQQLEPDASHLPGPQRMRAEVSQSVSHDQSYPASLSQRVGQAFATDSEQDRLAILEVIKQQACEQLQREKQPSNAQRRTLSAPSSGDQIASPSIPWQSSSHDGQVSEVLSIHRQAVSAAVSHAGKVAIPAVQQQPTLSQQGTQKPMVMLSSSGFSSTLPSISRHAISGVSSHTETVLSDAQRQAVVPTSSRSGQQAQPVVRQQFPEQRATPQMCSLSATSTLKTDPSHTDVCDSSVSVVSSSSAISEPSASVGASTQHDTLLTKEKLLQLKEKVQKKGSVELDRQKIISRQLDQLRSDATVAETTPDDVESCSSETHAIEISVSSSSVARSSQLDEDVTLSLELESSDSELTLTPAKHSNKWAGGLCCRASGCSAAFKQYTQLATHYTESHPCDFGPPSDEDDLAIYNRCMTSQWSTARGKRKRSPSTSQQWRARKKARNKSRSARHECDDCGRCFARSGDLNRHVREEHFISTDDDDY